MWTSTNTPMPAYGDCRLLTGLLKRQTDYGWAHLPRYYLKADDRYSRLLERGRGWGIKRMCIRARKACAHLLSVGVTDYTAQTGLLHALMLGYRRSLPASLREAFATTGTLHIFAISGLHVGIAALLVTALLRTIGIKRTYWILWLAPFLFLYILATGMKPSAIRAGVMAIVYGTAFLFTRKPDAPSALAFAAIIITAVDPAQLNAVGFILSFTVVAGILALYPVFSCALKPLGQADPWRVQQEPFILRHGRKAFHRLLNLMALSLAAWCASAPLTAHYFNLFAPIGLLGNILIVPGTFLVVLTGCLSLVSGAFIPLMADIFNHANLVFITILLKITDLMRAVPGGHFNVRAPAWPWLAGWYILLGLFAFRPRRMRWVLPCMLALVIGFSGWSAWRDHKLFVDVLDVGEGNAVFVNLPGTRDMLVDTGPSFYAGKVLRHLQRHGVNRLGVMVLTHADAAHAGAASTILKTMPVGEIWCSPYTGRSRAYKTTLTLAERLGIPVYRRHRGQHGEWGDVLSWDVLHPESSGDYHRAGNASLVLRLARAGCAVLFMGGAGIQVERDLLNQPVDYNAPLMLAGNHGAKGSCSDAWLDRVIPETVFISVGAFNRHGHPDPDVLARIHERGIHCWRTDLDGGVRIWYLQPEAHPFPQRHYQLEPLE
jgi:competence protein ComEC